MIIHKGELIDPIRIEVHTDLRKAEGKNRCRRAYRGAEGAAKEERKKWNPHWDISLKCPAVTFLLIRLESPLLKLPNYHVKNNLDEIFFSSKYYVCNPFFFLVWLSPILWPSVNTRTLHSIVCVRTCMSPPLLSLLFNPLSYIFTCRATDLEAVGRDDF